MFFENYPIYYINLESRQDRDARIIKNFKDLNLLNINKVTAMEPKDISPNTLNKGKELGCTDHEIATTYSHLYAIKKFLETSTEKYGIFCEDDADLTNVKKIKFKMSELFKYTKNNNGCFQLGVSTREDFDTSFFIHYRSPWDFNCSTYIMSREYAKILINKYFIDNVFSLDNFLSIDIFDYRNSSIIQSTPVAEYIVYRNKTTLSVPLFSYVISDSSIQSSSEHLKQNIKSKNIYEEYWDKYTSIYYEDLINTKKSFFSNSDLDLIKIKENIKIVIPWRESKSRVEIFKHLINWYTINFPTWEIILSDSGDSLFNLSASRNKGIKKAISLGADVVVVSDADFFTSKDSLIKSVLNAIKTDNLSVPYTEYIELTEYGTTEFLKNNKDSLSMFNRKNNNPKLINGFTNRFWVCSGINIITKNLFEDFGGYDENYSGWGQEDIDYHKRYLDKYGILFDYIEGISVSLEHSRDEWKNDSNKNLNYFKEKHGDNYIF